VNITVHLKDAWGIQWCSWTGLRGWVARGHKWHWEHPSRRLVLYAQNSDWSTEACTQLCFGLQDPLSLCFFFFLTLSVKCHCQLELGPVNTAWSCFWFQAVR